MKSKLLLFLLLGLNTLAKAENNLTHLIVWAKDGTKVAYALAEIPKVTFTETDLVITTNGVEVNYSLASIARFTYENNPSSSITNLETDKPYFKLEGDMLLFYDLKANNTVSVYSLNGTLMFSKTIQQNGEYALSISNLNAGIYLITVNGLTYKILKK